MSDKNQELGVDVNGGPGPIIAFLNRMRDTLTRLDGPNDFSLLGLAQQRMQELDNVVDQVREARVMRQALYYVALKATQPIRDSYDQYDDWHRELRAEADAAIKGLVPDRGEEAIALLFKFPGIRLHGDYNTWLSWRDLFFSAEDKNPSRARHPGDYALVALAGKLYRHLPGKPLPPDAVTVFDGTVRLEQEHWSRTMLEG
jgi:hypothetical protein